MINEWWDEYCRKNNLVRFKLIKGDQNWQTHLVDLDTGKTVPILAGDVTPGQEDRLTIVNVKLALVEIEDLTTGQDGDK